MNSDSTNDAVRRANQRFASIVALYDPGTFRALEATGIGPDWHCLEVGGGSGSVAAWLGERVGATGHVVVTEIDDLFLTAPPPSTSRISRYSATTSGPIRCPRGRTI